MCRSVLPPGLARHPGPKPEQSAYRIRLDLSATTPNARTSLNSIHQLDTDTFCTVPVLNHCFPMTMSPGRAIATILMTFTLPMWLAGCVQSGTSSVRTPSSTAAVATASASPAAPKVRGPIPVGTPVVLYRRTFGANGLYAASWSGALYKVPTVNLVQGELAVQSPDGSRLAIGDTVYDTSSGSTSRLPFDAITTDVSVT